MNFTLLAIATAAFIVLLLVSAWMIDRNNQNRRRHSHRDLRFLRFLLFKKFRVLQ